MTVTEQKILDLVLEGLTNEEIGARLYVCRSTIRNHLTKMYKKVGVKNRTQLVRWALTKKDNDNVA